jgi:MoaA/NifB/PqqE/SkfB family radical SAM enzyme
MPERNLTLLWALRSRCASHGCLYCYFGTIAEHLLAPPATPGRLSHLSPNDLTTDEVLAFARTLHGSTVRRVFLAGGEPLLWRPVMKLVEILKDAGAEVVICTSGVALNRPDLTERLITLGVDAVSVSLDSTDPAYNDTWRPPHHEGDGWKRVVAGITALVQARGERRRPRVGIYSVITRQNLADITSIPRLAADLGCDYAVPQPISLPAGHHLYGILALTETEIPALCGHFDDLYAAGLPIQLPSATYPGRVLAAVERPTGLVRSCFGGTTLRFIEPDGSVWDCPSSLKIAATAEARHRTIRGAHAGEVFGAPPGCGQDCALFSVDCVNMWPLVGFDNLLDPRPAGGAW